MICCSGIEHWRPAFIKRKSMQKNKPLQSSTVYRENLRMTKIEQLSGLAYNPTCRFADHCKIQIVYNTGRNRPCGGQFFTPHTVHGCPASLSHQANNRRMCYRFLTVGAYPGAKVHQKGRWPGRLLGLPSCKISLPYVNPRPRYLLPKILQIDRQTDKKTKRTVTHISPVCLSACADNELRNNF